MVAGRIREIAEQNGVVLFSAPPLARALYFSTDLNQEIPRNLFLAVAQVMAYVFQLRQAKKHGGQKPKPPKDLPVPEEYEIERAEVRLMASGNSLASQTAFLGIDWRLIGLGAPLLVIMLLAMMILPLPPFLLDFLFTFNIALSLIILLVAVYIHKPLEFGVFPSVLLIMTLLRLALNIASTRVVLIRRA